MLCSRMWEWLGAFGEPQGIIFMKTCEFNGERKGGFRFKWLGSLSCRCILLKS